jgi:hypothetical protein
MALGDSDLGVFFQDGVKVVLPNGTSAMANLDWPENVDFLRGQLTSGAVVAKPTITYATDSLGLMSDMPITVDGRPYAVDGKPRRIGDGKISVVELKKRYA